ncbi:hypothetical protein [uncultured Bradyrhizobium sp.]|uniref:hypothetical protein n=1 Tax=uncultured Bradyrhizobium sp. TaxID=199684 RepID=UPI0035CCA808
MTIAEASPSLLEQIEDIALLRPHLVARRADLDAERLLNREHIYAVDTNVVYFCAQPLAYIRQDFRASPAEGKGQRARGRSQHSDRAEHVGNFVRYGSIFRSDPIATHAFICELLARYIGFSVSKLSPLYVPQSLEPELAGVVEHFASFVSDDLSDFYKKLTEQLEGHLVKLMMEQFPQLDTVSEKKPDFGETLRRLIRNQIGKPSGNKRLDSLFSRSRIAPLAWIDQQSVPNRILQRSSFQKGGFRKLGDITDERDKELRDRRDEWADLLQKAGKEAGSLLDRDAAALAEVELWNETAIQADSSERLLYLTADSHVHGAAQSHRPPYISDSFAVNYVRHPSSFLEDFGVGSWKEGPASPVISNHAASLLGWIDVLMSDYADLREVGRDHVLDSRTRAEIRTFQHDNPGESRKVQESWRAVTDIQEKHLLDELGFLKEIEDFSKQNPDFHLAGPNEGAVADFHRAFLKKVMADEAKAWESCFRVAAEMLLKRKSTRSIAARSSPPVCFEGWEGAGAAVEQFKFWGVNAQNIDEQTYNAHREKLQNIDSVNGATGTNYAYYLAFAALFAGRSNWEAASALAAFAREVSNQIPASERRGANGREAAFLEAACRRLMAVRASDLDLVTFLLNEADSIFRSEEFAVAGEGDRIVPERFELERLDVDQTRLLFGWDFTSKERVALPPDGLISLYEQYRRLHERLERRLEKWLADRKPNEITLGSIGHVMMQTEIRLIISTFSLFSLDIAEIPTQVVTTVESLLQRLGQLQRLSEKSRSEEVQLIPDKSYFAQVVTAVTRHMLHARDRRVPNDERERRNVKKSLSEQGIEANSVYPFDPDRFARLREILDR